MQKGVIFIVNTLVYCRINWLLIKMESWGECWGIRQHERDQNTVSTTEKNTIHFRIMWMDKMTETKYSHEDIDASQKKRQFLCGFLSVHCPSVKGTFCLGQKEVRLGISLLTKEYWRKHYVTEEGILASDTFIRKNRVWSIYFHKKYIINVCYSVVVNFVQGRCTWYLDMSLNQDMFISREKMIRLWKSQIWRIYMKWVRDTE